MVLAVALNPALDVTYRVRALVPGTTHRVLQVTVQAGGKAINVARILRRLDVPVRVLALAGGTAGQQLATDLVAVGVPCRIVAVPGETRRCVAVVPEGGGAVTEFNEPGPEVPRGCWDQVVRAFREELQRGARVVVLSGSLPPGLPVDAYAELCRMARTAGIPALLDTSGDALRAGLAGRPAVVKPNRAELAELVGWEPPPGDPLAWLPVLAEVRARGAEAVVASSGRDGLLALTHEGAWQACPPPVEGNPVGAGDAAVAALARGVLLGTPWPERLRDAAALSAAAVAWPVAGGFEPEVYARARAEVQLRCLD